MILFGGLIVLLLNISVLASDSFLVIKVIDGDTIVAGGQKIRYIGVNAPEIHRTDRITQELGEKAKAFNETLVLNKTIRLEFDVQQRDKYGRLLAYVYVGDIFVNAKLLRDGYVSASVVPPNVQYADFFRKLETEARESGRGLWAK